MLGSLLVELGINASSFHTGLDAAGKATRQFAGQLKNDLNAVGRDVEGLASRFLSFGNLFGGLGGQAAQFGSQMSNAFGLVSTSMEGTGGLMSSFIGASAGVAGAAAAVAVAWGEMATKGAELVHEYELLSIRTGISVTDLQTLKAMGSTVGLPLETLAMGMRRFSVALSQYSADSSRAAHMLHALGVSAHDPMTAFEQLADRIKEMHDPTEQMAVVTELFGARMGGRLLPALREGKAGMDEWNTAIREYGELIGPDAIEKTNEWERATSKLGMTWEGVKIRSMGALTVMTGALNRALALTQGVSDETNEMFTQGEMGGFGAPPGASGGESERKKKQDAIDAANKAQKEANERQGKINDGLAQQVALLKEGGPEEAKLADAKKQIAVLEDAIKVDLGASLQLDLEQLKTLEKRIPLLEQRAKIEKEAKEYAASGAGAKRAAEDTAKLAEKQISESSRVYQEQFKQGMIGADELTAYLLADEDKRNKAHVTNIEAQAALDFKKQLSLHADLAAAEQDHQDKLGAIWRGGQEKQETVDKKTEADHLKGMAEELSAFKMMQEEKLDIAAEAARQGIDQARTAGAARDAAIAHREKMSGGGIGAELAASRQKQASDLAEATAIRAIQQAQIDKDEEALKAAEKELAKLQQFPTLYKEQEKAVEELRKKIEALKEARDKDTAAAVLKSTEEGYKQQENMYKRMTTYSDEFFDHLNEGIVTGKANWGQMLQQMEMQILKMAEKQLFSKLFASMSGGDAHEAAAGEVHDNAAAAASGAYRALAPIPIVGPILGAAAAASAFALCSGFLAEGGDAAPGKAYIVGERGPEVMVPKSAGTVMPNSSLAGLMGGGNKNVNISLTHNVTAIDSGGIKDMLDEHGPLFAQSLMDHLRKSNAI